MNLNVEIPIKLELVVRVADLLSALGALTNPDGDFDSAFNPGPERDELLKSYNLLRDGIRSTIADLEMKAAIIRELLK